MQLRLSKIEEIVVKLHSEFERYRPLIEKFEMASQANSFLKQRKIMRKGVVDTPVDNM